MPDTLTRAIRDRNLSQATSTITQLQKYMSQETITSLVMAAVERLAWEEGDRVAAVWLLRSASYRTQR